MRRSADEVREALVDALIRLLAERPIDGISVRDVANAAGVNHGLVHRYFGSKEGLAKAAAERASAEVHAGSPGQPGMSAFTFRYLRERPHLARLMARACLDGPQDWLDAVAPDPDRLEEILAPIRAALTGANLDVDARTVNGVAVAALLGWFTFRPLLERGFGVPASADDEVDGLLEMLDALVAGAGAQRG